MLTMLWLVLTTGVGLINIHGSLVVLMTFLWFSFDAMLITGVYTRLTSKNSPESSSDTHIDV